MCEAIKGIREDAWTEGQFELLVELVRKEILTEKVAAENSGMTLEEFKKKVADYNKTKSK